MLKFRHKVYISNPHKEFCALLPTFLALTIPGPTSNHYTTSEYTSIVAFLTQNDRNGNGSRDGNGNLKWSKLQHSYSTYVSLVLSFSSSFCSTLSSLPIVNSSFHNNPHTLTSHRKKTSCTTTSHS